MRGRVGVAGRNARVEPRFLYKVGRLVTATSQTMTLPVSSRRLPAKSPSASSKTLDKGLRLLRILADHPEGLGVGDLSRRVDLHRTITYRLLGTLMDHSLVSCTDDGAYKLGIGLVTLSRSAQPALREAALRHLTKLAENCDATAFLVVRKGEEAVVLESVEPRNTTMHVAYRIGTSSPLSRGASGIAILSAEVAQKGERKEVSAARKQGYSITEGELSPGAWGLAAPLVLRGKIAEASIGVVTFEPLDETKTSRLVLQTATAIAKDLA